MFSKLANITTVPIKNVFGDKDKYTDAKVSEWFILENLYNSNLLTDIKNINYNKYFTLDKQQLKNLTPKFCDNIMLFTIVPQEYTELKNKCIILKEEHCSTFNTLLRSVLKENNITVAKHSVKCKQTIKLYVSGKDTEENKCGKTRHNIYASPNFEKIKENYLRIYNKQDLNSAYIITYKLELADEEIKMLHPKLEKTLKQLQDGAILFYILDFDVTQDKLNNINYDKYKTFLLERNDFRMEGDTTKTKARFIILNNCKSVGNNIITIIDTLTNVRMKWYNKFVCQITSGGVTKTIGSHIYDFLYCPDKRLNKTFRDKEAKECSITRAEATIYGCYLPTLEQLNRTIKTMDDLTDIEMFYKVSFKNQFRALTEQLENNLILYNKKEEKLYITYYGNSLTRKITATTFKLNDYSEEQKQKVIEYALSHYSIQALPCYYVEININKDDITLLTTEINKEIGETQIFKNNKIFTSKPKRQDTEIEEIELDVETEDVNYIKNAGLDSDYLPLFLPETKQQIKSKILFPIKINKANKLPSTLSFYNREKLIKRLEDEEIYNKQTELQQDDKSKRMEEINKIRADILTKSSKIAEVQQIDTYLSDIFSSPAHAETLLTIGTKYMVNAFKVQNNNSVVVNCIFANPDNPEEETNKLFFAPEYLKLSLLNNIDKFIVHKENIYTLDRIENPFFIFVAKNLYTGKDRNKHMFVEKLHCDLRIADPIIKKEVQEVKQLEKQLEIKIEEALIKTIDVDFKVKDLEKMEILKEDAKYTITHLKTVDYRGKTRYAIIFAEEKDKIYISNNFFEKEIDRKGAPTNIISMQTLNKKTTDTKVKQLQVIL